MPAILQEWENFAKKIAPEAAQTAPADLRDHAEEMLRAIAADIDTPQSQQQGKEKSQGLADVSAKKDSAPETHALTRLAAGYSITQLVAEYRALRASVLRRWGDNQHAAGPAEYESMLRFNEAIDQAVSESVSRFSSTVRESQNLFLAIIGHDVRTPIGAINMSAQVLLRDVEAPAKTLRVAARILNSAKRVDDIVRDLLDFATTTTGDGIPISPSPTDLAATCQNLVEEARMLFPSHVIVLELEGELEACVDEARISQVFSNLIANAVQHGSDVKPIKVIVRQEKNGIHWSIHNEGIPITSANLKMIFDPAQRYANLSGSAKQVQPDRHLGLGLFVAREIIKAHGGSIHAVSNAAEGTTFSVRLPLSNEA